MGKEGAQLCSPTQVAHSRHSEIGFVGRGQLPHRSIVIEQQESSAQTGDESSTQLRTGMSRQNSGCRQNLVFRTSKIIIEKNNLLSYKNCFHECTSNYRYWLVLAIGSSMLLLGSTLEFTGASAIVGNGVREICCCPFWST